MIYDYVVMFLYSFLCVNMLHWHVQFNDLSLSDVDQFSIFCSYNIFKSIIFLISVCIY
jgi:hypothetical protein